MKSKKMNPRNVCWILFSLLWLGGLAGCEKPSPSSEETPASGGALENLFAGSGEMEKTQEARKLQQEKMLQQQKELQKKRLDSYDPHR
ncbi:MAG TPA: hypothetical protein PLT76_06330 [Candidatus Omnitrophota bacterium]|nr:hypothetical protein [Candidatus Omnitrophota bacterium]HPB68133.1 hypothetical protein [Candidatus Omnitrophota bacterium]HQO58322.1 hypothetical protein [Candidatus Omnitrophota bacterium]HQP11764.1 hypothetical protein [Candidatus Omnitrophota bacterium]